MTTYIGNFQISSAEDVEIDVVRYLDNLDPIVIKVKEAVHNATLEELSPDVDSFHFYWTQPIALTDKVGLFFNLLL